MESFKASVQYGDWKGSCAADDADSESLSTRFRAAGLLSEEELIVAIKYYSSYGDFIYAYAYMMTYEDRKNHIKSESEEPRVRRVRLEITPTDFMKLFKRLDIVLLDPHSKIEGLEYRDMGEGSEEPTFKL